MEHLLGQLVVQAVVVFGEGLVLPVGGHDGQADEHGQHERQKYLGEFEEHEKQVVGHHGDQLASHRLEEPSVNYLLQHRISTPRQNLVGPHVA